MCYGVDDSSLRVSEVTAVSRLHPPRLAGAIPSLATFLCGLPTYHALLSRNHFCLFLCCTTRPLAPSLPVVATPSHTMLHFMGHPQNHCLAATTPHYPFIVLANYLPFSLSGSIHTAPYLPATCL